MSARGDVASVRVDDNGPGIPAEALSALVVALTRREREVAEAVADGQPSREIAERLSLSMRTVEMHRARAMRALGVKGTAEMIGLVLAARAAAPAAPVRQRLGGAPRLAGKQPS